MRKGMERGWGWEGRRGNAEGVGVSAKEGEWVDGRRVGRKEGRAGGEYGEVDK